ncbi:response regulator transcription factor [Anaeromicropila herbilytica]|uniref:Stage 0 sporulation protein A homolog n=1 Tax=Anaeromicropila herbilytica TaxID=2785025 RepID=A0A7R7IBU7_9FIRM|nr:response regulator [Anaeromicropila herbilytica]BCN29962.1 DNA-binding response regulator [Anaeromicropila herbilytica]
MNDYCKVMVIDDEFIMRQGMRHLLDWEKEGFQIVAEASNGQEGMELIEEYHPHIILADIVMPVIDGMEFSRLVHQKYPDIQIVILSSYDKFEYVKSTLLNGVADYILKPTLNPTELLKVLKKVASRIPGMVLKSSNEINYEKLMERYLIGFETELDTRLFEDYFKDSCFRLFGTNLKQLFASDKAFLRKTEEKLEEFFIEYDNDFTVLKLMINKEYLLFIINYKLSKDSVLKELLDKQANEIAKTHDKIHYVLSNSFHKITEVKEKFENEFQILAESFFYHEDKAILLYEDIDIQNKLERFDFTMYSSYLNTEQYNEAIGILLAYMEDAIAVQFDSYKLKNLAKNLIYNMIITLEQTYNDVDKLRQEYFFKIDDTFYVSEFIDVFHEFIEKLKEIIQDKPSSHNVRIQEIMNYILEHSSEDLDLAEVAKAFNFNYYYLSSYFNSHIKEGFSDYLNKIRVDKACTMLKQSRQSIADISEEVGYTDQSYFSRVFKKITGYTPSAYRRRYHL